MKTIDGIWHYTFKDMAMSWSPDMFKLFRNKDSSPYPLTKIHQMIHPLDRFKWELAINQATLGGAPSDFECRVFLDALDSLWLRHRVKAVIVDGIAVGLEGICSDVTDLKIAEMEKRIDLALFRDFSAQK